ncbi:MAG: phytanoyl-CoA dioxygenase [Chloroflexi bacterium]|jgi:phytanoyl-CoA hydroxylase|nr:phytanoyl-CoA dioxygenase [Chloroflexota bacterium]MBT4074739.1 phytanoyl-CoA dioxygenase [Chloroflexota bacterium]MBT4515484.1 phytanoyl-CoA dioxygenase [Chloroflexota bacterium]MBT6681929.1 phytanoyl-CoA dioxygenase [Chloroflexota bacterium]
MTGLSEQQQKQFQDDGYLLVEDLFDPKEVLDPLIDEYEGVMDRLAFELHRDGKIQSRYENLDFSERVTQVYQDSGKVHAGYFDFSLPQSGIKYDTPMWHGPRVFDVLSNTDIVDVAESVLGPEILSNPVQHVRIKPPEKLVPVNPDTGFSQLGATPWHQDNGVINETADQSEILTVWFPVWDADEEAGCLSVVPKSHTDGLLTHCPGGLKSQGFGLSIPENLFDTESAVPVPVKRGSVLLLTSRTCHNSLSNNSDRIRWSLDLRYNPIGQDTGRDAFPGFVARSAEAPESELHDADTWARTWRDARFRLAQEQDPVYNRWNSDDPACA